MANGWGRSRTADTGVFSAVLYRLSYPALSAYSGGGIRTHDLVVNSHPLWPLSYPGPYPSLAKEIGEQNASPRNLARRGEG